MNREEIAEAARTLDHLGMTALWEENKRLREVLEAVEARLTGNFDHPALEKLGALDTLKENDVLRFVREALKGTK